MTTVKPSSMFWSGPIPEEWAEPSLRYVARIKNGADYKEFQVEEGGFPVIGSGGEFARTSKFLHDGESVLLGRKGTVDKPLYVNGRFWAVDTMFYTSVRNIILPKYLYYFATTIPYDFFQTSTAVPSMTQDDLGSIRVPLPSLLVQERVIKYLDRKTARIDVLIAKQERLIELLVEKRQAIASAMVSSSVAPTSADPGFRLTYLYTVIDRRANGATLPLMSVSIHRGVQCRNEVTDDEPRAADLSNYKLCEPGDIVINRMRAFQGALGVASEHGLVSPDYLVIRPAREISATWLATVLRSHWAVGEMRSRLRGIGSIEQGVVRTPRINARDLGEIRIRVPSLAAQNASMTEVVARWSRLDSLIGKCSKAVALLQERRSALISAAVTGKIDVREGAA